MPGRAKKAKKKRKFDARYGTKKNPQLPLPTEERVDCQHEDAPEGLITVGDALAFRDITCHKKKLICCSLLRLNNQH